MSTEIDDAQKRKIAEALTGVMRDGQRCLIQCSDGDITVDSKVPAAEIKQKHADLYGQLLTANEAISDAGGWVGIVMFFTAAVFCLAIHMAWFNSVLGVPVERLQSFWLYLLVLAVVVIVSGGLVSVREQQAYRRHRQEVLRAIADAGSTKNAILTAINDDPALKSIAEWRKKDRVGPSRFVL